MNSQHVSARRRPATRMLGRAVIIAVSLAATLVAANTALAAGVPGDRDARSGKVQPTAAQQQTVSALGAMATWNDFGTPRSLTKDGGYLATGLSGADAATAARNWVSANKALFRLSSTDGLKVESAHTFRDEQCRGSSRSASTSAGWRCGRTER